MNSTLLLFFTKVTAHGDTLLFGSGDWPVVASTREGNILVRIESINPAPNPFSSAPGPYQATLFKYDREVGYVRAEKLGLVSNGRPSYAYLLDKGKYLVTLGDVEADSGDHRHQIVVYDIRPSSLKVLKTFSLSEVLGSRELAGRVKVVVDRPYWIHKRIVVDEGLGRIVINPQPPSLKEQEKDTVLKSITKVVLDYRSQAILRL